MRRLLPPWAWLLVVAILFVGGMLWLRVRPPTSAHEQDPLAEAASDLEKGIGLQVDPASGRGGGLAVIGVKEGSPAQQLGLQAGDRVIACGSQSVWHTYQLLELMKQGLGSGYPVALLVEREGTYWQVVVAPGGHTHPQPPAAAGP
jgi:C-terminal processing protease CtpA/Prc